jgi:hypothetical protein
MPVNSHVPIKPGIPLDEILALMKVPKAKQNEAFDGLRDAIDLIVYEKRVGTVAENIKSFWRIETIGHRLLNELEEINEAGRSFLDSRSVDDGEAPFSVVRYMSATRSLLTRVGLVKQTKRAAQRPKGSVKNRQLRDLVFALVRIAHETGGKLTLGMNISARRPNGTLPAMLKIFHVHFPTIIPNPIPYSTLDRERVRALDWLRQEHDAEPPLHFSESKN